MSQSGPSTPAARSTRSESRATPSEVFAARRTAISFAAVSIRRPGGRILVSCIRRESSGSQGTGMSERVDLQPDAADAPAQQRTSDEWTEAMARTVAHMAAQLTMSQIRLRALATEMSARGIIDDDAIARRAGQIAAQETGAYLRENLGTVLADLIDVESLENEIVAYLNG